MYIKTKQRSPKRGFTLIELLVVIAIITMLLSMLMPSLRTAKEKSRQVVCNTNLHSLLHAWEMYAQSNSYKVCPPFTSGGDGGFLKKSWVNDGGEVPGNFKGGTEAAIRDGLLWSYLENLDVYNCPTDRSDRLRSYALSFAMGGVGSRDGLQSVIKAPRTSGKLVFIDSEPGCPCSNKWIAGSFSPIKANAREWVRFKIRSDMTMRHSGGCNVAMADGSCTSWKWRDPQTIEFIQDKSILSLPVTVNEDFEKIITAMKQMK